MLPFLRAVACGTTSASLGAQLEPGGEQLVLSSSGDRSAAVWDLRKVGKGVKALASASQTNTILSAYWAPNGARPKEPGGSNNGSHHRCSCKALSGLWHAACTTPGMPGQEFERSGHV